MNIVLCAKNNLATLKNTIRQIVGRFEVDRAVFFGVLSKIWAAMAGPVTAVLIVIRFTPEYQGYYYTFNNLLALQIFVELGLGTVIIQFASHEWSKLKIDERGGIGGDKEALSRLASLANISFKWYFVGGILIAFGLGMAGYIFFLCSQTPQVNWSLPWLSLCCLTGINICFIPIWSLLEGCNQVSAVYTYRFFQGIISSVTIWIAIFWGAKLWSASLSVAAIILCAVLFLKYKYGKFIKILLFSKNSDSRIGWKKEIFPMQWRIALSWISGYFVFALFTPVIFKYYGPVVAGQFGMTWSIVGIVSAISGSWIFPKVPKFGMLIVRKRYAELDSLFIRIMKVFAVVTILSALAVWLIVYLLNILNHPFAARLLPVLPTTIFLLAQALMVFTIPFSSYLRAHKKEPLLFISLCGGLLTALATFILVRYSIVAIGYGYLTINIVLIPFIILIWQHCRATWHVDKQLCDTQ
jgi:O-antigen/teichoic acid export membrane protein